MDIFKAFVLDGTRHEVNILWLDGKPLFRANEIAKVLELRNIRSTLSAFDEDEKTSHRIDENDDVNTVDAIGRVQTTTFLTEAGLYRLLMISRKPVARPFQKWVTQILISIRETGKYELQLQKTELENKIEQVQLALKQQADSAKADVERKQHQALVDAFKGPNRYVVYIGKIRVEPDGSLLVKIGSTQDLKVRSESLVDEFGAMSILKVFDCPQNAMFERFLQKHPMIITHVFKDVIHNNRRSNGEVFNVAPEFVDRMISIATKNLFKFSSTATAEQAVEMQRVKLQRDQVRLEETRILHEMNKPQLQIDIAPLLMADLRKHTQVRGSKVQRYSPDGKTLVKTYSGHSDAMREKDLPDVCRWRLKNAIANQVLYKGFRWAALERGLPDDTIQDIGPTVESTTMNKGFVVMMNLDKTRIEQVFCDQKEAAEKRQFKGCAAICNAIKRGSKSGGHYFVMWHDCCEALQTEYLTRAALPAKRVASNGKEVVQLHPITGSAMNRYSSIEDVVKAMRVSRKSLSEAIEFGAVLKGYKWACT